MKSKETFECRHVQHPQFGRHGWIRLPHPDIIAPEILRPVVPRQNFHGLRPEHIRIHQLPPLIVLRIRDHLGFKTFDRSFQPSPGAPESECSGIIFKDGNVVFVPSTTGLVLLGGEDASMTPLCQPAAVNAGGTVTAPPITTTFGSQVGLNGPNGQFPTKVLIK